MFEIAYIELKKSKDDKVILLLLPSFREKDMNEILNDLIRSHEKRIKIKGSRIIEIAEQGLKALLEEARKVGHEKPEKPAGQNEDYFRKLTQFEKGLKIKFIMCLQDDLNETEEMIQKNNHLNTLFSIVGYGYGFNFSLD